MIKDQEKLHFRRYILILLSIWTLIITFAIGLSWYSERNALIEVALNEARAAFQKDLVYREWVALREGVYVLESKQTPMYSEPGKGITIKVLFPASESPAEKNKEINKS